MPAFYFKSIWNAAAHRETDVTKKAGELLVKTFGKTYNEGKVIEVTQELQECQIHKQLTEKKKKKKKKTRQLHRGVLPGILGREVAARFSTPVFRPYGL